MKLFALLFFFLLVVSCTSEDDDGLIGSPCRDTNCANYTSQAAAQAAFNADPDCRNDLDRDNDGVACEEPGNSVRDCSSTSSCGCSNLNMSPCDADPCCRWTVGSGCGCN